MAFEDQLQKKIKGAIFGFKQGTKTAKEVNDLIKRMEGVNAEIAKDLNKEFVEAANEKNKKK